MDQPNEMDQRELVARIRELLWVAQIAVEVRDEQLLEDARKELWPLVEQFQKRSGA